MSRVTIYSLDVLLFLFGTSLLFLSLLEFSTVYCDLTVKGFGIVNKAEIDVFSWNFLAFFMIQDTVSSQSCFG